VLRATLLSSRLFSSLSYYILLKGYQPYELSPNSLIQFIFVQLVSPLLRQFCLTMFGSFCHCTYNEQCNCNLSEELFSYNNVDNNLINSFHFSNHLITPGLHGSTVSSSDATGGRRGAGDSNSFASATTSPTFLPAIRTRRSPPSFLQDCQVNHRTVQHSPQVGTHRTATPSTSRPLSTHRENRWSATTPQMSLESSLIVSSSEADVMPAELYLSSAQSIPPASPQQVVEVMSSEEEIFQPLQNAVPQPVVQNDVPQPVIKNEVPQPVIKNEVPQPRVPRKLSAMPKPRAMPVQVPATRALKTRKARSLSTKLRGRSPSVKVLPEAMPIEVLPEAMSDIKAVTERADDAAVPEPLYVGCLSADLGKELEEPSSYGPPSTARQREASPYAQQSQPKSPPGLSQAQNPAAESFNGELELFAQVNGELDVPMQVSGEPNVSMQVSGELDVSLLRSVMSPQLPQLPQLPLDQAPVLQNEMPANNNMQVDNNVQVNNTSLQQYSIATPPEESLPLALLASQFQNSFDALALKQQQLEHRQGH
jgi:hypothetical protein